MSAAFQPSLMMMQRPLGSSTAFSIDSLIGSPPPPAPGHFVYTGYPMFMPYRPVVLPPPPPPPPALPQGALQPALPPAHPHHHQLPSLPTGFCSSLAQGMALTSTLMATLPGTFPASPQHQEAARKFAPPGNFDKAEGMPPDGGGDDGKAFLGKDGALLPFPAADTVQASLGLCFTSSWGSPGPGEGGPQSRRGRKRQGGKFLHGQRSRLQLGRQHPQPGGSQGRGLWQRTGGKSPKPPQFHQHHIHRQKPAEENSLHQRAAAGAGKGVSLQKVPVPDREVPDRSCPQTQ
ncbi:homeobox protein GBX-2 isoform X2 [Columba livia]|uniref:homeobox protein GBX-2 isoform X2 n=1 Tax=Columba livia TaxID=8932 RepID=UPI0031BA8762